MLVLLNNMFSSDYYMMLKNSNCIVLTIAYKLMVENLKNHKNFSAWQLFVQQGRFYIEYRISSYKALPQIIPAF